MKTPKFSELQGEDSLIIKQESNGIGLMGGSYIIISVPKSIMRNYKISTASGSLHFNVPSEDASLYTASGSINVNSVVETLKVKTSSGSIKIYEGGNSIDAKTESGSIKIYQPYQEITAKTSSGSIKLTVNSDSKEVNAKTSSGSIKIRQQDKVNYSMKYDTNSGSVKDDYLGITYDHSGKIEQPNSVLSIDAKTNSGSIKLIEWNDNY